MQLSQGLRKIRAFFKIDMKTRRMKYCFLVLFFLLLINGIRAQDSSLVKLSKQIDSLLRDESLAHASWGICVMNTESNDVVFDYNSRQSLVPASTLKLVTSGAAINLLGHDYRFNTLLQYDGKIDHQGTLNGNLYIKGSGDPSFGSARFGPQNSLDSVFKRWLKVLKEKNIRQITGTVIADPDIFDAGNLPSGWMWGDIGNYYGVTASGLNVMENKYYVWFRPGMNLGDSASVVKIEPYIYGLNYINHVKTAASGTGDNVNIYGSPMTYLRFFEGTVPMGNDFTVRGSVPDPPYLAAILFYKYLIQNGIDICMEPTTTVLDRYKNIVHDHDRKKLAESDINSLPDIITQLNYWSINVYAESLLKLLGSEKGTEGSTKSGIRVLFKYLEDNEIDASGMVMDDGSGLSHLNRISTWLLARILAEYTRDSEFPYFYKSIPLAGNSGTMTDILKGTIADGRLHAKSGGLEDVKSYAGYVTDKNGEMLSFSIIFNSFQGTSAELQKKLVRLMLTISEL